MKTSGLTGLSQWYIKRPLRERVILFVCLLVVGFSLGPGRSATTGTTEEAG